MVQSVDVGKWSKRSLCELGIGYRKSRFLQRVAQPSCKGVRSLLTTQLLIKISSQVKKLSAKPNRQRIGEQEEAVEEEGKGKHTGVINV